MTDLYLSFKAKKMLKHFKDTGAKQSSYEHRQTLVDLFGDVENYEAAERELYSHDLIDIKEAANFQPSDTARSAALTFNGVKYINQNSLD